jgi:hypothetical protein
MLLPRFLGVPGLVAIAVGTLAFGAPRGVWQNDGFHAAHSPTQWVFAVIAAAGASVLALTLRSTRARVPAFLVAAAFSAYALVLGLWQLDVTADRVSLRTLWGTRVVQWAEVARLDTERARVVVWPRAGQPLVIDTAVLTPTDRAPLERAVARRVREAAVK